MPITRQSGMMRPSIRRRQTDRTATGTHENWDDGESGRGEGGSGGGGGGEERGASGVSS